MDHRTARPTLRPAGGDVRCGRGDPHRRGIGVAPLAIWRRQLKRAGIPARVLLGFRDRDNSSGLDLFDCSEVRLASEDGHTGHRGYVTDLLAVLLEGDDATSAAVYACGPPAMLESVRSPRTDRGVACELAMEAPMACGTAPASVAIPQAGADTCGSASTGRSSAAASRDRAREGIGAFVKGSGH